MHSKIGANNNTIANFTITNIPIGLGTKNKKKCQWINTIKCDIKTKQIIVLNEQHQKLNGNINTNL